VAGLNVRLDQLPVLKDVSFSVGAGERVGIIGESGSGKSVTALAVLGLGTTRDSVRYGRSAALADSGTSCHSCEPSLVAGSRATCAPADEPVRYRLVLPVDWNS
jgi:ABC-type glutathione transport system ATPase component